MEIQLYNLFSGFRPTSFSVSKLSGDALRGSLIIILYMSNYLHLDRSSS